jgi:ABC-2 type transport system permease protein
VIGLVLLALAAAAACVALLTLADASIEVLLAVTVLCGSAVTLGFALAPLIGGAGDPLDPRRFALLGLPRGKLTATLALAGFVSVPTAALAAVSVCLIVVWIAHGTPVIAAVLGALMGIATCVLSARVSMALTSLFLRERRSRELTGLFALAILVVVVPAGVFFASLEWDGTVPTQLSEAVAALALTPVGAAWAYPGRAAQGSELAWVSLLIAVATLVLLALAWTALVRRLLTTTERPTSGREHRGLGWFGVAPGTPGGAVAARSLLYWFRDRRYLMNLLIIPIAAAVTMVPLLIAGVPPQIVALVPVPFVALFLGWLPHNDLAYDSTAVWMHIASGLRGASDRIGRLVPPLLIGLPFLAIAIPISISLYGRWALLPAMVGACAALFLSGLGLSSIASVVAPYAVSRPGESPFQQPQRTTAAGGIAQGVVLVGAIVVSAPVLWWSFVAIGGDPEFAMAALWGGLLIGVFVLVAGVLVGSAVYERSTGRLMEFAEST